MRLWEEVQALPRSADLTAVVTRTAVEVAADAEAIAAPIRSFIVDAALHETDDQTLIDGVACRLRDSPIRLSRMSAAHTTLHPLIRAQNVAWTAASGLASTNFFHADPEGETFRTSPLRYVLDNALDVYRHRLDGGDLPFPAFREFAAAGATEYVAMLISFSAGSVPRDDRRGVFFSFCSNRPGGLDQAAFDALVLLRQPLALAFRILIERAVSEAIATTYLGRVAAQRVLAGAIRRGDAEVVPAAIWYSDLRSFTPLVEDLELDDSIAFLNEVFEATAGAVGDAGGEVLDFIGDAVLAIFPVADDGMARALAALDDALSRLSNLRERHSGSHVPAAIIRTASEGFVGIAIAAGDVRFGNIGTTERLSFSVIGPTVNMVARIEALTKMLREPVLVTAPVAELAPDRFVLRGAFALEGVRDRRALYGLVNRPPR